MIEMTEGIIFDIEEFSVHDGPGIRTAVFLKGCPLRCVWCHNPEGISPLPQLTVKTQLCVHCGKCREICPNEKCAACGLCVNECPLHIRKIAGYKITVEKLAEKIRKNKDFYDSSGGGVTFSGGEPLMQHEFLFEVMRKLNDVHKLIETSGHADSGVFTDALKLADMIIMDIKHTDTARHKNYTGSGNEKILKNLEILKTSGAPFIIRIPLIPDINDGDDNLKTTAELLSGCASLIKVELLPYNKFAGAKYSAIGKKYEPPFNETKKNNINQEYFQKHGIRSVYYE